MAVIGALAFLWCGLLLGVSFLATPVKFMAPSLTLPVALDVGRQTFLAFNRLEWVLCVAAVLLWLWSARTRWSGVLIAVVSAVVLAETFWLLPTLDSRVQIIIAGQIPEPSGYHNWYIALEAGKAVLLLWLGVGSLRAASAPFHEGAGEIDNAQRANSNHTPQRAALHP